MATYLYRIGKFAYRRKGIVLPIWLAILVLMGVGAATLSGPTNDSVTIPGTPAQAAQDLMTERFPDTGKDPFNQVSARFVFAAPEGQTLDTPANQAAMDATLAKVREIEMVDPAAKVDPATATPEQAAHTLVNPVAMNDQLVETAPKRAEATGVPVDRVLQNIAATSPLNEAKTVGVVAVPFTGEITDVTTDLTDQIDAAAQVARDAGLTAEVSGSAAQVNEGPGGSAELIGLAVAAVVLLLTFGSLVAAGLPLISAIIGVGIASLGITVATGFTDLGSTTPTLAVMIGLAVAIDYSLFIVSRFRHEITVTGNREEAAGRAVGTAGSAVVFAGLTVVIALVALRVVGIKFLTDMGLAAAFAVVVAVLIALTFLPAMFGLLGKRVFGARLPFIKNEDPEAEHATPSLGTRYARGVARRPLIPLIAGILILGVLAIPAAGLKLALPTESTGDPTTSPRKAYDLVAEGFGPGRNAPLLVVVDAKDATTATKEDAFAAVVKDISGREDVVNAQVVVVNPAGDTAQILVTPGSGPTDPRTVDLMKSIRAGEGELHETTGVNYGVTGQTALETDVSDRLQSALIPYLIIVVGLAFILLMLVFRSILVPLTAALGFLLSVAATFGATVAIFQEGWGGLIANPQPLVSFMPIFLIGVVFGLAMDYQVFLVTRMREEYVHGASAKDAMTIGFSHGSRVVTAAALIMMSVFGAFILEPNTFLKSIGFALAAAVFFDAFLVRMVLIPAVMAVLGDKAWWLPKWLDKILPNVDIEGEKLRSVLPPTEPVLTH